MLYIVPTPIGNLGDITIRALEVLKKVDVIACEDTRVTKKLLNHFDINNQKLISHHEHNEKESSSGIIRLINDGKKIALVSDAGFPGISDPGFRLISSLIENKIDFEILPGASSILPALLYSGFETNKFSFYGFVPQKKGRQTFIKTILEQDETIIIFESVHRIEKLLKQIHEIYPSKEISISRELTKLHEEIIRGTAAECLESINDSNKKGEFVVVIRRKK